MFKERSKETMKKIKEYLEENKKLPIISYSNSAVETFMKELAEKYDEEVAEICVKVYKYMVERRWNLDEDKGNYYLDKYVTVGAKKMADELDISDKALKNVEQILESEGMLIKLQFRDKYSHLRNVFLAPKTQLSDEEKSAISRM